MPADPTPAAAALPDQDAVEQAVKKAKSVTSEIGALIQSNESEAAPAAAESAPASPASAPPPMDEAPLIDQSDLDELMRIHGFISETAESSSRLTDEICDAILDSGRLTLQEWRSLRDGLAEIEELIPHIDLIIKLKGKKR